MINKYNFKGGLYMGEALEVSRENLIKVMDDISRIDVAIGNNDIESAISLKEEIIDQYDLSIPVNKDIWGSLKKLKSKLCSILINLSINIDSGKISINFNISINDENELQKTLNTTKQNISNIEDTDTRETGLKIVQNIEDICTSKENSQDKFSKFKAVLNYIVENEELILKLINLLIVIIRLIIQPMPC